MTVIINALLARNSLRELCNKLFDLITTWVRPVDYSLCRVSQIEFDEFQLQSHDKPTLVLFATHRQLGGFWSLIQVSIVLIPLCFDP